MHLVFTVPEPLARLALANKRVVYDLLFRATAATLLQVVAMMAATTILQAVQSQSVDIMLAFCLMVGGTIGAQFGASAGQYLRGEQLRFLLAALVLAVAIRFGMSLVLPPGNPFSMAVIGIGGLV